MAANNNSPQSRLLSDKVSNNLRLGVEIRLDLPEQKPQQEMKTSSFLAEVISYDKYRLSSSKTSFVKQMKIKSGLINHKSFQRKWNYVENLKINLRFYFFRLFRPGRMITLVFPSLAFCLLFLFKF